jgi:uncharacterized protein
MRAQSKLYFMDPFMATLAHRRNQVFNLPDASRLSEQQLGLTLARCLTARDPARFTEGTQVLFERTSADAEIDFVGPDLTVPFESKYVDGGWKREARTMRKRYGSGVLATRTAFDVEEDVWGVPTAVLAWIFDG